MSVFVGNRERCYEPHNYAGVEPILIPELLIRHDRYVNQTIE